ncbi:substrate-binding domain-containing protein [Streptomyces sp. NPDC002690]
MNVTSRVRAGAVVGAVALALGAFAAPAAIADPPAAEYRTLAGVGSDTTQDVVNALGNVVLNSSNAKIIASYDATGSATIKTRATNCVVNRPNGSSAGITALAADVADTTVDCIDFARSSRGVKTAGSTLTWIPFAKDAVSVAVRTDSALYAAGAQNLTTAQLASIYTCSTTTLNGVTLTPLLPQTGSGTRSFFLEKLGLTDAQVGSCVDQTVQENNGVALNTAGDIAPYSVAQYIAQVNAKVSDIHGTTDLIQVNSTAPYTSAFALNTGFTFTRDVYNVVPTAKLTDATIASTFVGSTSKVCAAGSTITSYGFGSLGTACGATTITGNN